MKKALEVGKREGVAPIKKMVGPLAPVRYQSAASFTVEHLFAVAVLFLLLGVTLAHYGPAYADRLFDALHLDSKATIWH